MDELTPAELDAEIEKFLDDISTRVIDALLSNITDDPIQQELQARRIERVTAELAGQSPTPTIKMLARSVAVLSLERDRADLRFYRLLGDPDGLSYEFTRHVLRWRDLAHRKLNSTIRTLAYVRHIEMSSIERSLDRFRIAS